MAGKTDISATLFAQKKLLGKAHTSNIKIDGEEVIGSNIQTSTETVFGDTIPGSPTLSLYTAQSASLNSYQSVEYIQFVLNVLTGTTYDANDPNGGAGSDSSESQQTAGPHTYKFKLPSNYETLTNNSRAGNGVFSNSKLVHETLGQLQLVPPLFSQAAPNPYIVKLYKDDGSGGAGDEIPLLDNIDWNVDYYNGIIFIQDYNASKIPAFARAFAYVGRMTSETIFSAFSAGNGLISSPSVAGSYTFSINDSVVATVSGTTFTGVTKHNSGLSGSLTKLTDGSSFLVAGAGIAIVTGSNGSVIITNDGTVGDITSVNAGTGLFGGGSSGNVTLDINNSIIATVSGTTFTGTTKHTAGLSGSLTNLTDGSSFLKAGGGINVVTGSNGSVIISLGAITYATASFTDVTSISVNHDIGLSLYDIEVFDVSYGKMIPKSATATSSTQANIEFSIPTSGWIAVGGPVAGGSGTSLLGSITTSVGSAPYLGTRAWVSFNGTGVVVIRSSMNVSSITDNDIGQYTVNFTTQMEDTNYAVVSSAEGSAGSGPLICGPLQEGTHSTSAVAIHAISFNCTDKDSENISVFIAR